MDDRDDFRRMVQRQDVHRDRDTAVLSRLMDAVYRPGPPSTWERRRCLDGVERLEGGNG